MRGGGVDSFHDNPLSSSNLQHLTSNKVYLADSTHHSDTTKSLKYSTQETKTYSLGAQIVSANKFDQNLREIDGSVAVVSGKTLQDLQINNAQDLSKIFPGFVLDSTTGAGYLKGSVRGISSVDFYNPSMVVYVDGIPQDPEFIAQELLDVKRVELLRGPQGTIWGQNAQSGVLNIVSNPISSNTPRIHMASSLGNLAKNTMLSGSTPLIEDWLYIGGNLSYNRFSGMLQKTNSKEFVDTSNSFLGSVSIGFAPKISGFSALFKYSKDNLSDHHNGFLISNEQLKILKIPDNSKIPLAQRNMQTYSLKLEYDLKKSSLSNVFSYQEKNYSTDQLWAKWGEDRKTITEELRLNTQYNNGAYSIFGLYYQHFKNGLEVVDRGASIKNNNGLTTINKHTLGIYAEGKIPLIWDFDFTLGGRYSYDYTGVKFTGISNIAAYQNSHDSHIFTPKVAIGYNINEIMRFYMMYQIGYKPGGFDYNASKVASQRKILPEYSQNAELGIHSSFWDDRISLDIALYYIYTTDKQVQVGFPGETSLGNAGIADSKGLELSFNFLPIDSFRLSFGGTFGHSGYIDGKDPFTEIKLLHTTLSYAPDITMNLNLEQRLLEANKIKFFINFNGNFYSKIYFDEANTSHQEPYGLLDGSLRMELKNNLTLNFYVQNIFNQKYIKYNRKFKGETINGLGNLRNIGLSINYKL